MIIALGIIIGIADCIFYNPKHFFCRTKEKTIDNCGGQNERVLKKGCGYTAQI